MDVSIVHVGRAKLDVWTAAEPRKWFKKMLGPPFPPRILSLVFVCLSRDRDPILTDSN